MPDIRDGAGFNSIPCYPLDGRFYGPGANKGVETDALLGFRVTDVSEASGTLTVDFIDSAGTAGSLDYTGAGDGVLASGSFSTANQTLTLTLADGTNIPLSLSGFETAAEVTAAINAALASRTETFVGLTDTPSSIIADNCVKGNSAGDALAFGSCGSGGGGGSADGRVSDFIVDATGGTTITFTVEQTEGIGNLGDTVTLDDSNIPDLPASKITSGEFGMNRLATNSVHAAQLAANSVHASEIAAGAVGSSEIEAGAVTEANMADNSVGHEQLTSNSVRVDEIQANAVGHSEMQDAAVGIVELRDDAAERLCPDPGTGTSGQVCARNAAGDAYELVTQTGGGGGGGTDDQIAAEVAVSATAFTGNLSATDTNVQTALQTIDGFTLGGGGGGAGTSEQRVESVTFADVDNITSTATTLTLAATTPIAVEFGDGAAEILTGTAGETTFTIAECRRLYLFEFEAIYPADGDRDHAVSSKSRTGQR